MANRYESGFENDDERLSALIDGELGATETAEIEMRLAREPALARRLARLRRSDQALCDAYGPVAGEPLGEKLTALLQIPGAVGGETPAAAGDAAKVVPLRRRAEARSYWMPTSIAAGIALAIGLALGVSLGPRDGLTDTERLLASGAPIGPGRELFEVMETMPSGETATLAGELSATPRLTFRTADGGFCREVGLSSSARQTTLVGCRGGAGWTTEAVIQFTGRASDSGNNGFVPASGPDAELDAFVDALMAGDPLGAAAEREAIASGWR